MIKKIACVCSLYVFLIPLTWATGSDAGPLKWGSPHVLFNKQDGRIKSKELRSLEEKLSASVQDEQHINQQLTLIQQTLESLMQEQKSLESFDYFDKREKLSQALSEARTGLERTKNGGDGIKAAQIQMENARKATVELDEQYNRNQKNLTSLNRSLGEKKELVLSLEEALQKEKKNQAELRDKIKTEMLHHEKKWLHTSLRERDTQLLHQLHDSRYFSPKDYQDVKKEQLTSSAAEISGALAWAHRQGIVGEGIKVGVIESGEPDHPVLKKQPSIGVDSFTTRLRQLAPPLPAHETQEESRHTTAVTSCIYQMAPRATIITGYVTGFLNSEVFDFINFSMSTIKGQKSGIPNWLLKTFPTTAVIKVAGNDGVPLSTTTDGKEIKALLENKDNYGRILIVGAIDTRFNKSSFSSYPADDQQLQERFLCTLGEQVSVMVPQGYDTLDGTSFATPIVTGAAALLKSRYPRLTPAQVCECLLASAEKNFFIPNKTTSRLIFLKKDNPRTGYEGTFVYDPAEGDPQVKWPKNYKITYQPFDPRLYGRGVLNLRNAFIYAHFMDQGKSEKEMKELYENEMRIIEERAANTIKQVWRKHKESRADTSDGLFSRFDPTHL